MFENIITIVIPQQPYMDIQVSPQVTQRYMKFILLPLSRWDVPTVADRLHILM